MNADVYTGGETKNKRSVGAGVASEETGQDKIRHERRGEESWVSATKVEGVCGRIDDNNNNESCGTYEQI